MGDETQKGRRCGWCGGPLMGSRGRYCCQRCRQTAFRLRRRRATVFEAGQPLRFAYADPPYPGLSRKYYRNEPTFAGEVNHAELIGDLETSGYAGWALSTSARALREILPLCPPEARVCAWCKPIGVPSTSFGLHNTWEALIVVGGRQLPPGRRDWLRAMPARGGGSLPGRKPLAFCAFLFDALGMLPGDELDDRFPGTGIVARSWARMCADRSLLASKPRPNVRRVSSESPTGGNDAELGGGLVASNKGEKKHGQV